MNRGLLFAILLLWPVAGFAEEEKQTFSYLVTNDFTYQKSRISINDSDQYYNSSSFFLKYGNWAGGLSLRAHNYYRQATSFTFPDPEVELYRRYIQYTTPEMGIQAGDFNAVLGRGLVLSVLPNEKAFRDRTVLGGDFSFRSNSFQFRTLGGTVESEMKQQKWGVAGAELVHDYWKGNRIGVHASYIHDMKGSFRKDNKLTWSVSWSADKLPGGFSYYAEISRLDIKDSLLRDGSAYYSNLGWTRKNVTLLFEFKKYERFNNGLNNPPSADRGDEGLVDLEDSQTVRLYSQYSFFNPDIVAFVSVGRASESGYSGPHIYTGASGSDLFGRLDFAFGYSYKNALYPVKIVDGQATFRLVNALAAGFITRDKRYVSGGYRFNEKDWVPQISWAPYGSVYFQRQYSRDPIDGRNYFDSYGIRVNVKRDSYFEFSTGVVRGGEVCSSGQCIFVPPFRGWKIGLFATLR